MMIATNLSTTNSCTIRIFDDFSLYEKSTVDDEKSLPYVFYKLVQTPETLYVILNPITGDDQMV
jgi:hypothetical protein